MADSVQMHNRFAERLRPRKVAVVLVDCQEGPAAADSGWRNNLLGLARLVRAAGLPVQLGVRRVVAETGMPAGPILAELREIFPDVRPTERCGGTFWDDPAARAAVRALGRREIILAGIMPDAVAATAIAARFDGYSVHAALDVTVGLTPASLHVERARMSAAGVHMTSWVAVMAEFNSAGVSLPPLDAAALRDNLRRYAEDAARWAGEELTLLADGLSAVPKWS